jgi:hypothetical protein
MAATWKSGTYLVSPLSALTALLVGLFTLPVCRIVGTLLVIGGMALQLTPARVCAEWQNPRMSLVKKAIGGRGAIKRDRRPPGWSAALGGSFLKIMHQMKDLSLFDSALSNRRCRLILSTQ